MTFLYTCIDFKNKIKKGEIIADDKSEAISLLKEQGFTPIELIEGDINSSKNKSIWEIDLNKKDRHKVKINKKKILAIMEQMAIMLRAGVLLSLAMEIIIETQKDKLIKEILVEMNEDLYSGIPLSFSMSKFEAFSNVFTNIISAGEASGRLEESFERISNILEKEINLESKIKGALGYPLFLLGLTVIVIFIINIVILPVFATLFSQLNSPLPPLTVALISTSNFIKSFWYLIIIFVVILILAIKTALDRSEKLSFRLDEIKLNIPVVGSLLISSYIARFCLVMSSMVGAGVDIVSSIEISRDVIPNKFFKSRMDDVIENVRIGNQINISMAQHKIFDPLLVSMIRVGEETGMLYETLKKMSELYEEQTQQRTKLLTSLMEPAMTIIIALMVGLVVLSVVMPMFNMYSLLH